MTTDLFDRFKVIDVDTHLTEPPENAAGLTGQPDRPWAGAA